MSNAVATLMGVCATIANKMEIDVFIVRVITLIIILSTGGMGFLVYFLLGLFATESPK